MSKFTSNQNNTAPHIVRNANSRFDTTRISAARVSKGNKISRINPKQNGERRRSRDLNIRASPSRLSPYTDFLGTATATHQGHHQPVPDRPPRHIILHKYYCYLAIYTVNTPIRSLTTVSTDRENRLCTTQPVYKKLPHWVYFITVNKRHQIRGKARLIKSK